MGHEVGPHLQGPLPDFLRVAVHLVVFPSIPQIGFVIVKHYEPAFVEQTQPLRRQVVVLVDLG